MKKRIIFICCIFCTMLSCINLYAKNNEQSIQWSIQWNGLIYTGTYTGETEFGRPNGKGEYHGELTESYPVSNEIDYRGKWKDGKMEGKGVLTDLSSGIRYEGKFKENKLNGEIKKSYIEDENILSYSITKYTKDVPYGISRQYDPNGKEIGYDYMFFGMSISELCEKATVYDYKKLSYMADEYKNNDIKLECQVLNIYDEDIIEEDDNEKESKDDDEEKIIKKRILEVKDKDGNKYFLIYKLDYEKYETIYMPLFKEDDKITIYGYYAGIETVKARNLPSINVVYGLFSEMDEPDVEKLSFEYMDFLNYPYVYQEREIHLKGTIKGTYETEEKNIYVLVDANNYSNGKNERYICKIKNNSKILDQLPNPGERVTLEGVLSNIKECGKENGQYIFYPMVKIISIDGKNCSFGEVYE